MATSGQVNTNTTYDSYFWVAWSQSDDQDIANNRTKIAWSCGVYCGHTFYSNAIKMSAVSIDNSQVYEGGTYSNFSKGNHTIASGELWIDHNSNGAKNLVISPFTGWLYSGHNYSSNGDSYALTQIPRQAEITSAPDFTDLDNPTIFYKNPAGNAVTELKACISFTGAWDDIGYRDIPKTEESYPFPLTDEERDKLRNNTTGPNRKVIFFVRTKIGDNFYYSTQERTFSIVETEETEPCVNMDIALNNGSLSSAFDGLYIQGKSKLDIKLSAEGKYSASITNLYAVADGKTYSSEAFTTDVIQSQGNIDIVGYAKDSRKFTSKKSQPINVIPYSKPLVEPVGRENAILCYRSDENGIRVGNSTSVWIKAGRTYYSVSGKNFCALQWRRKLITEEWNDSAHLWKELIAKTDATTNEYNALLSGEMFDLKQSYSIQIRAIDDIGEQDVKTFEIPTQDVALHLGKGGKNVSVGTYCDCSKEYTFYSDWDAYFDKDIYIGNEIVADFIVEEGRETVETDEWTYRKWNSGLAECWGKMGQVSIPFHEIHNNTAYTYGSYAFPSSLFCEAPEYAEAFTLSQNGLLKVSISYLEASTIAMYVSDNSSDTESTRQFNLMIKAIGRWK